MIPTERRKAPGWVQLLPATAVLVLAVPLAALVVTTWVVGWRLQPLKTNSMRPGYDHGSLLVVAPVDPADVAAGSVIVFQDPTREDRLVAHRVTRRIQGTTGVAYATRGDANAFEDPFPVPARAVRGEVRWSVPELGALVQAMTWPRNAVILVGLPATALIVTEIGAFRRRRKAAPVCTSCCQSA